MDKLIISDEVDNLNTYTVESPESLFDNTRPGAVMVHDYLLLDLLGILMVLKALEVIRNHKINYTREKDHVYLATIWDLGVR